MIKKIFKWVVLFILLFVIIYFITNLSINYYSTSDWFSRFQIISSFVLMVFTLFYLLETREMVLEQKRQRRNLESPSISLKIDVENKNSINLNVVMKNSGGGPAYDISVRFYPDINYNGTTLSNLNMFNEMPLLDKGEKVSFFLDTVPDYLESDNPDSTTAEIKYYDIPEHKRSRKDKPIIRKIKINIREREGQLQFKERNLNELVKEIKELKEALLILHMEKEEGNKSDD